MIGYLISDKWRPFVSVYNTILNAICKSGMHRFIVMYQKVKQHASQVEIILLFHDGVEVKPLAVIKIFVWKKENCIIPSLNSNDSRQWNNEQRLNLHVQQAFTDCGNGPPRDKIWSSKYHKDWAG